MAVEYVGSGSPDRRLLTVRQAHEYLGGGISVSELYRMFDGGHLRGVRVGSKRTGVRVYQASIDAWLQANENGPPVQEARPVPLAPVVRHPRVTRAAKVPGLAGGFRFFP